MSAGFAVQLGRHALAVRGDDFYETPSCATQALIKHEQLAFTIWEPACGAGAISSILKDSGFDVISTDLVDRGYGQGGVDFLMESRAPLGCSQIVTNPPFKLMDAFVRHGLSLCTSVIVLARWAYAEGAGRTDLIDRHLDHVLLGKERLPFMHRHGFEGPKNSNSGAPFAWFVFKREPECGGQFWVRRISWRDNETALPPGERVQGPR